LAAIKGPAALGGEGVSTVLRKGEFRCHSLPFPSTAGTLRDPNNFGTQRRKVREELGVPEVTTHSFRKAVATLIDDDGLFARIGAKPLGRSNVSMTQDRYMTRGRIHHQVADLWIELSTKK
jgi:integrase